MHGSAASFAAKSSAGLTSRGVRGPVELFQSVGADLLEPVVELDVAAIALGE